ncbi:MAG: hypothetical protein M1368_08540 [Thaumarchaeota archaeon]|nr:hypothetical protein [Nitrososphaerota archaeon]
MIETVLLGLPTWNPGDPSYALTYVVAVTFSLFVIGLAAALALNNPRLRTEKKETN